MILTLILIIIYLAAMYICVCNGITERQIREAVQGGADTLSALSAELGVATCCGTCTHAAQQLLQETPRTSSRLPAAA